MDQNANVTVVHLTDPAWYQATTLTERIASLQASCNRAELTEADREIAENRLEHWRSEPVFADDGSRFAERLKTDGIVEEELRHLLGEPTEVTSERLSEPPAWLEELAQAFSEHASSSMPPFHEEAPGKEAMGFLYAIEPLIVQGRERMREGIQNFVSDRDDLPFSPEGLEELLFTNLPRQLLTELMRTMVLELNVARVENSLEGATSEERFYSFVERLHDREVALKVLKEYPVLARHLVMHVNQWIDAGLEFASRLCVDWDEIEEFFCTGDELGDIVELEGDAGDRHCEGRSVHIVKFSSGLQLVYKPRSQAVGVHFQELLSWLNKRGDHPPFRTLQILDRGTHGWVEYVEAHSCSTDEEVRRFYQRQGSYLALLYALRATDFHYENLIACGEHPILVDLESLFHPSIRDEEATQAVQLASSVLRRSVLQVGLLPQRLWASEEQEEGIDVSGMGGSAGQLSPHRLPYWENAATDHMHFSRKQMEIPGASNRPTLDEMEVDVLNYKEDVLSGFAEVYRLLIHYRDELISEDGPLVRFAGDEVRYIARPTRTYAMRLFESFHPDLLRDALDRDRFFDSLWVSKDTDLNLTGVDPQLARLFPYERRDLHRGDIPMFTTRSNSCQLWTASGQRIPDYFDSSALTSALERVRQLDEEDLERQTWIIRASFTALTIGEGRMQWPRYDPPDSKGHANQAELLSAACKVGDRLELLALKEEEDTSWLDLTMINERTWSLVSSGVDLYSGLSGTALFLGYLGNVSGEARYTMLAERTLNTIRRQWEHLRDHVRSTSNSLKDLSLTIGAFNELGGTIHTLTHLGSLWDWPELLTEAEEMAEFASPLIDYDKDFDIVSGAAGCMEVLLGLYNVRPSRRILELATRCGDHLVAHASPAEQGVGWFMPSNSRPLTGFSHGTAGIAHALLRLATETGEKRFREVGFQAIEYERSVFSPVRENWPDFRDPEDLEREAEVDRNNHFMIAWCHGAPGIGLARLDTLRYADDPGVYSEVKAALRTTLAEGFGINHSLCHGALGNLELFLEAGRSFDDPKLLSHTYRVAEQILQSIDEHGWLCGVPSGVETPGLMTGLSGVGYGLLRLTEPERVPSILSLRPPVIS